MNPACSCSQHILIFFLFYFASSGSKANSQNTVKLFQCKKNQTQTFCILAIHGMKLYCKWHDSVSISTLVFLSLFVISMWYLHIQKNTMCHNKKVGFYVYVCGEECAHVKCLCPWRLLLKNIFNVFCGNSREGGWGAAAWREKEEQTKVQIYLMRGSCGCPQQRQHCYSPSQRAWAEGNPLLAGIQDLPCAG